MVRYQITNFTTACMQENFNGKFTRARDWFTPCEVIWICNKIEINVGSRVLPQLQAYVADIITTSIVHVEIDEDIPKVDGSAWRGEVNAALGTAQDIIHGVNLYSTAVGVSTPIGFHRPQADATYTVRHGGAGQAHRDDDLIAGSPFDQGAAYKVCVDAKKVNIWKSRQEYNLLVTHSWMVTFSMNLLEECMGDRTKLSLLWLWRCSSSYMALISFSLVGYQLTINEHLWKKIITSYTW